MRRIVLVPLLGAAIAGCTSVEKMRGPNGETLVSASCGGIALDYGDCVRRISEECPNGYAILNGTTEQYQMSSGNGSWSANPYYGQGYGSFNSVPIITRNVMAVCKGA